MNIQELQTIRQNHLPIKLSCKSIRGYHSIDRPAELFLESLWSWTGAAFPDLQKLCYSGLWISVQMYSQLRKLRDTIKEVLKWMELAVARFL